MVLSPFAWVAESTHRQLKAENSLFPSAKRIWTPLSEHAPVTTLRGRAAQPAQKLTSNSEVHRDAVREALPPFPPSPELCTVTRQLCQETPARCKKDTGQDGWGYSGESCSQSPLPFHFRYIHNGASCLQGYRARLSRFQTSETSPIGRAEGSPPAFKSGGWNWGPPASLRQVTEMVLQPGDAGPHQEVGSPRSGSCFSKHPRCWFETESLSRRDYNT